MPSQDDLYHLSLKAYRDNKNAMDYAVKVAAQEARLAERLEVAREMKTMNMPVKQIMKFSKLSRQEVEKL